MSNSLMTSRRFAPLFWCQFFSAFNDNFLKNALVFLILFRAGYDANTRVAGHAHGRRVHRAVLLPLGPRRPDGRPLRQGDRRAPREARRDRGLGARRRRLLAALRADHVRHAVPVRRDRHAVRPDQIRHPARSPEEGRAARRQRAGRRRDLHGDPARHHRGRPRREGGQPSGLFRRDDRGVLAALLGREPADPAHRPGRAQSPCRSEHRALDRLAAEGPVDRQAAVVGRASSRAGSGWSARSRSR